MIAIIYRQVKFEQGYSWGGSWRLISSKATLGLTIQLQSARVKRVRFG
jgi:hypothetical protein